MTHFNIAEYLEEKENQRSFENLFFRRIFSEIIKAAETGNVTEVERQLIPYHRYKYIVNTDWYKAKQKTLEFLDKLFVIVGLDTRFAVEKSSGSGWLAVAKEKYGLHWEIIDVFTTKAEAISFITKLGEVGSITLLERGTTQIEAP